MVRGKNKNHCNITNINCGSLLGLGSDQYDTVTQIACPYSLFIILTKLWILNVQKENTYCICKCYML